MLYLAMHELRAQVSGCQLHSSNRNQPQQPQQEEEDDVRRMTVERR